MLLYLVGWNPVSSGLLTIYWTIHHALVGLPLCFLGGE